LLLPAAACAKNSETEPVGVTEGELGRDGRAAGCSGTCYKSGTGAVEKGPHVSATQQPEGLREGQSCEGALLGGESASEWCRQMQTLEWVRWWVR
jgi:hypothetical protein